jgi:uncharacterized protein involved in exopolysaccharide biosynthesis
MDNNSTAETQENKLDIFELFSTIWAKRKFVIIVATVFTMLAIGYSFILTPTYLSETSILPDTENSKLGGLAELASLAGVSMPGEMVMIKLYPDMMKSETVLRYVIDKKYNSILYDKPVNLYEYFKIEEETPGRTFEVAVEALRNKLKIELNLKTGLISCALETKDAKVTADILNTLTESLNKFLLTKKTTNAGEQRKWIDQRLKEVKSDLEKAENGLKDFREKNRRVIDSPQLLLEQERLIREVQIQSTMFTTLKQQYEIAKIEEIKNVPIINVMDEARPAAKKNSPKRRIIAVVGFLLGLFGSAGYVFVDSKYRDKVQQFTKVFNLKES